MELDLDESSLAIGRIERALSRIEKALTDRANRPAAAVQPQRGAGMGRHGRHDRPGAERQAGPIVISDVAAKLGQRFDAMDSNRDGVISLEERRAARAAHRAERPARRASPPAAPQAASPAPTSE